MASAGNKFLEMLWITLFLLVVLASYCNAATSFNTSSNLLSNNVNDVFVYNTANDTLANPLWKSGDNIGKCAMDFDWNGDYVTAGNIAVNTDAGAVNTVEFWMRWNGSFLSAPFGWNQAYHLLFWNNCFGFNTYAGDSIGFPSEGMENKWYHVVGEFYNGVPSTTNTKIYLNGVQKTLTYCTGSSSTSRSATSTIHIGRTYEGTYQHAGSIDELRIYNRGLTQAEITGNYQRGLLGLKPNITSGLVAAYGFDDCVDSNVTDESGNGKVGIRYDAKWKEKTSWHKEGNSKEYGAYFDGNGDYISTNTADFSFDTNPFAISLWAKLSAFNGMDAISDRYYTAGQTGNWDFYLSTGYVAFYTYNGNQPGSFEYADGYTTLSKDVWHHIFFVREGTGAGQSKIYIDGMPMLSGTISKTLGNTSSSLLFGKLVANGWLNGSLDNIRIYNKSFSAQQIKELYNLELIGGDTSVYDNDPKLFGYWDFDNVSRPYFDKSSRMNNGTAYGNAAVGFADYYSGGTGVYGKTGVFDGNDDYMSAAANGAMYSTQRTIEAWIKPDVALSANDIIAGRVSEIWFLNDYAATGCSAGKMCFMILSSGVWRGVSLTTTLQPGIWYHIVGTYDGSNIRLYLNGILEGGPFSSGVPDNNGGPFDIGSYSGSITSYSFDGKIDEVRYYNRALSTDEIKNNYLGGLRGEKSTITNGLVMYYGFNDNLIDESNNAFDLTAYNGAYTASDTTANSATPAAVYDQAAVFDGSGDSITTSSISLPSGDHSFSFWLKTNELGSPGLIRTNVYPTNFRGIYLDSNKIRYYLSDAEWLYSNSIITDNRWHQITARTSGTNMAIFIDGVLDSQKTTGVTPSAYSGAMVMGLDFASDSLMGSMDEMKIYSRALTDSEINQSYLRGMQHLKSNLSSTNQLAYWDFDGDYLDKSGNGIHGTRVGDTSLYGRSGTKNFPDKTYLVATDKGLDVIDSNDNSLWMRFNANTNNPIQAAVTSLNALNGKIYTTLDPTYWGVHVPDFIKDENLDYTHVGGYKNFANIADRNSEKTWMSYTLPSLVSDPLRDISVASVSNYTYMAVATDGGVSVINESRGTVANFLTGGSFKITDIFMTKKGDVYSIYAQPGTNSALAIYYNNIADASDGSWAEKRDYDYHNGATPKVQLRDATDTFNDLYVTEGTSTVNSGDNTVYLGLDRGATTLQEYKGSEASGKVEHYVAGPGKISGASANFDGNGDYIDAGNIDAPMEGKNDYTISLWVKARTGLPGESTIIGTHDSITYSAGWNIVISDTTLLLVAEDSSVGGPWAIIYAEDPGNINNTWIHLVLTRSGNNFQFYKNGAALGAGFSSSATISNGAYNLQIGGVGASSLNGAVDEVRIYNRALTPSEITTLYNKGSVTSGQILYYPLDYNYSDMSGSGNHGTKQGETFLAYTIISGNSSNVTSITADSSGVMYIGTDKGGVSVIDTKTNILKSYYSASTLTSNNMTSLSLGSLLYGTKSSGAGVFDVQVVKDIYGMVSTAGGWVWQKLTESSIIKSGTQYNWTWRQYVYESGRKTVSGTQYNWTWTNE